MSLLEILKNLQGRKITPEDLTKIRDNLKKNKVTRISLWEYKDFLKKFMRLFKVQCLVVALAGSWMLGEEVHKKYQQSNEKFNTLAMYSTVAFPALFMPLLVLRVLGKKAIGSIHFNVGTGRFEITTMQGSMMTLTPQQIVIERFPNGKFKAIEILDYKEYQGRKFSLIPRVGQWNSQHLFEHLVEGSPPQFEPL